MTQASLERQKSEKGGGREEGDGNKLHAPLQKCTYKKPLILQEIKCSERDSWEFIK